MFYCVCCYRIEVYAEYSNFVTSLALFALNFVKHTLLLVLWFLAVLTTSRDNSTQTHVSHKESNDKADNR